MVGIAITTTTNRANEVKTDYLSECFIVNIDKKRIGIAKSKNNCIKKLYNKGCEWIVLCDDDMWFVKDGWIDLLINASLASGIKHFIYTKQPHNNLIRTFNVNGQEFEEYDGSGGVLMFMHKSVIDEIGYFNNEYGLYGFEHVNYSNRAFVHGLMPGCKTPYVLPKGLQDYVYAKDYEGVGDNHNFTNEEKAELINNSRKVMIKDNSNLTIYYPFIQ